MIIKDLQPAYAVEREGFQELIALLEPRYVMVSRKHIQQKLLPSYSSIVEDKIKNVLQTVEACSITLDLWSSRRMDSYLGMTCHFISETWEISRVLLCCKHFHGRHTGEKILASNTTSHLRYVEWLQTMVLM